MGILEPAGITTGAIVYALFMLAFIAVGVIFSMRFHKRGKNYIDDGGLAFVGWLSSTFAVIMIIILLIAGIRTGFQTKYITEYTGTVVVKEDRVLFEYQFEGDDTLYNFNDFRIHTYVGKKVNVRCVPRHIHHGIDENHCTVTSISGAN